MDAGTPFLPGLFLTGIMRRPQAQSTGFLAKCEQAGMPWQGRTGSVNHSGHLWSPFTVTRGAAGQMPRQGPGTMRRGKKWLHPALLSFSSSDTCCRQGFAASTASPGVFGLWSQPQGSVTLTCSHIWGPSRPCLECARGAVTSGHVAPMCCKTQQVLSSHHPFTSTRTVARTPAGCWYKCPKGHGGT